MLAPFAGTSASSRKYEAVDPYLPPIDGTYYVFIFGLNAEKFNHDGTLLDTTAVDARNRIAPLCGRSRSTVSRIVTDWITKFRSSSEIATDQLKETLTQQHNTESMKKKVRIPYDHETFILVRDFVALKRSNRERITSSEVLHKLIETNICNMLMNNYGSFNVSD